MSHFNAILVGGPPHSGKSVLTYSLTTALRKRGVAHYVLRACPDGEGDWSNEAHADTVKLIRQKGRFTPLFVGQVSADLGSRHLPLLVDVGGKPRPEQEVMFAQCTHAVLLAPDEAGLAEWRALAQRNGLNVVAELISDLAAAPVLWSAGDPLRARISGLERGQTVAGPVFDALVERLATYLAEPADALRRRHLAAAPPELAVDIQDLAHQLGVSEEPPRWLPQHIAGVLSYLPPGVSIGLYGRGPNWLFGAVAAHAQPGAFHLFDVRLGWIAPSAVTPVAAPGDGSLLFTPAPDSEGILLNVTAPGYYLDYDDCRQVDAPMLPEDSGVILSGRVPHWLTVGLVLAYRRHPWVAVYQPQVCAEGDCAVIVHTRTPQRKAGDLVRLGAHASAREDPLG